MNKHLIKLLAIDTNQHDIRGFQEMLWEVARVDFDLQQAHGLEDGVTKLRDRVFDAILLDVSLSENEGLNTFEAFHSASQATPIVVLTGTHDEVLGLEAVRRGAQDYLVKGHFDGQLLARSICYAIERKRAECTILDSIAQRTVLKKEVLETSTREQQRISPDLHDGVGQELTGLSYMAKSLAAKSQADANTAESIAEGIQRALRSVHETICGLAPVELDTHGLMAALRRLAKSTCELFDIDCRFNCDKPIPVESNMVATHLYRVSQEAVHNAIKHAGAGRILIGLDSTKGRLQLEVSDDGQGIVEPHQTEGLGLQIMRYRAHAIGADFDIRQGINGGTVVMLSLALGDTVHNTHLIKD